MFKIKLFTLCFFLTLKICAQNQLKLIQFITSDITNFWEAYDSVISTNSDLKKLDFINRLYLDKGSNGLRYITVVPMYFQKEEFRLKYLPNSKILSSQYLLTLIKNYPKFFTSIREDIRLNTLKDKFKNVVQQFQKVFDIIPKDFNIYFVIGDLKNSSFIVNKDIVINAEICLTTNSTNIIELDSIYRERILKHEDLLFILTHGFVHVQQNQLLSNETINVLTYSIKEGAADFIAYLITGETVQTPYMKYGQNHEKEIWQFFKKEMYTDELKKWVFEDLNPNFKFAHLGHFIGYEICKSYYDNSSNKQTALKEILGLDYSNQKNINSFLIKSKYSDKTKN